MTGISTERQQCLGCFERVVNNLEPVCDSSGVIAITDWPQSRVVVCPEWPCDEDEPIAYYEALADLGYDSIPPTVQARIRNTLAAESRRVSQLAPYMDEPADDPKRIPMIVTALVLVLVMVGAVAALVWVLSR